MEFLKNYSDNCFLYINPSTYKDDIIKIGISNNPEKRLKEFNNSLTHLNKNGYCERIKFQAGFVVKCKNRAHAKKIEASFKKKNKKYLLRRFGTEVFNLTLKHAVEVLP